MSTQTETVSPTVENGYLQWAVPESLQVPTDRLTLRLDFFTQSVVLHLFDDKWQEARLVSAMDVAHALSRELEISTGLLPPNALFWVNRPGGAYVAMWREPGTAQVALQRRVDAPAERFTIPTPGLIFLVSSGRDPWVFAARRRPRSLADKVYKAPFFNVFANGRVCPGTHKWPADVGEIPKSFFLSFFSPTGDNSDRSKKHPKDLGKLWAELDGKKRYPVRDLVEHGTVQDIMRMQT